MGLKGAGAGGGRGRKKDRFEGALGSAGWREDNRMLVLQLAHCRPTPARDHHALQEEGDDRVSL
jgi:hypothetical protein